MNKYISLFSGIGAFESGLRNLQIPYELIGFSENDKYAVKSYTAIHKVNEEKNLGDITKIDERKLPPVDLITYGFPCQDISIAGKQKGLFDEDGSKTRSGLFFEALRIIKACKPKVAIAENVKNLTSPKFKEQFNIVLTELKNAGYTNYWKILNAKDFGLPTERVFIISIKKDEDNKLFKFPEPFELKQRLTDILDMKVDDKYYVHTDRAEKVLAKISNGYESTHEPSINVIGDLWEDNGHKSMAGRVYDIQGISPTLGASHFQQVKYIYDPVTKKIRSITPNECFRLLGFKDWEYEAAESVCSNTQLLKQIGNSIAVDVVEELLCMIFGSDNNILV